MGGSVNNAEALFRLTCVYLCVVARSAWPSSSCTARRSAPPSRRWVAKRVAQRVRVRGGCRPPVDDAPHIAGAQPCTPPVQEHRISRAHLADQVLAAPLQPSRDRLDGWLAHRDLALLRALAPDGDGARARVEVARPEPAQLGNAEATAVEQLEHRVVAEADGLVVAVDRGGRLVEQHLELVTAQHVRQPGLALRRVQA